MRTLEFKINCGETTCASEPGKFCEWFGAKRLGTLPICMLFGESLKDQHGVEGGEGWTQRCDRCLQHDSDYDENEAVYRAEWEAQKKRNGGKPDSAFEQCVECNGTGLKLINGNPIDDICSECMGEGRIEK